MPYFIVDKPTPILNTSHFRSVFSGALPLDHQTILREMEMIALPEMVFDIQEMVSSTICSVVSEEYPTSYPIYVDMRFGHVASFKPIIKKRYIPPQPVIIERLRSTIGLPYVWGGNFSAGIPEWKVLYPPLCPLSVIENAYWTFQGVDCSGLLYEAVDGALPRNTSDLIKVGVPITTEVLQPLDLIFTPGHVCIVLNESEIIESKLEFGGVRITPIEERLRQLEAYTVRRFHHPVSAA